MNKCKSVWQDKELATRFLEGVRGAIPCADIQLNLIGKIVQLWSDNPLSILDLGCGDGILGRYLHEIFPLANVVFVDFSEPMLEAARKHLCDKPQTNIIQSDFSSSKWIDAVSLNQPFDIIVSGFAIHHQPDIRKKELYTEIFDLLSPGGIFLNLEHVASCTTAIEQVYDEFFIDHLIDCESTLYQGKSRSEITEDYHSRPDKDENILAVVEEQCNWLREIGFNDVDCFFKVFELALFGGRKVAQ